MAREVNVTMQISAKELVRMIAKEVRSDTGGGELVKEVGDKIAKRQLVRRTPVGSEPVNRIRNR